MTYARSGRLAREAGGRRKEERGEGLGGLENSTRLLPDEDCVDWLLS